MNEILNKLAQCVEFGKINRTSPYPPNMKDQDGADELAAKRHRPVIERVVRHASPSAWS